MIDCILASSSVILELPLQDECSDCGERSSFSQINRYPAASGVFYLLLV